MNKDIYLEKGASKIPAIELLSSISPERVAPGYLYISPEDCLLQRGSSYNVLLKDTLRGQLRKINRYSYGGVENEFSANNIERAIEDLNVPLTDGLISSSEKIYDMLILGNSYPETVGDGKMLNFNLKYIDWEHPENNTFQVTQEFFVESSNKENSAQPDIVTFINGIPFAVIECKAPTLSEDLAVEQNIRNQRSDYIPQLFKFIQIVIATNKNAVKYATTGTPKKFWNVWKEDSSFLSDKIERFICGRIETEQDKAILALLYPSRALELIRYFIIYDAKVKKIARYQQYFAVKEILKTVQKQDEKGNRQGGVIWHTQGSGKSLTMVMLAKYLLLELQQYNPKVVVVTDRKELDRQITDTFSHTHLLPAQATTGRNLYNLIDKGKADIITTIINKFNTAEKLDVKNISKDVFLLVDESHRSNYGLLATKMRAVFPNACYLGFTGTPLMKKEKNTMSKFGSLIHKYTIQDGVNDKAIVPLIYEGRFVEQTVDEANIDLWFEQTTKRLTDLQKQDLKQKWSNIRRLTSTNARIKRIALDINNHFTTSYKDTEFKAMLATNFKRDAIRYLECFEQMNDLTCAVLISPPDVREGYEDIDEDVDEETDSKVNAYWKKMMNQYGDAETYEETIKDKFLHGDIDILIVCSKLLTGFDAPICQILYIDKELKEHGLLQAIARTNRLADGKDYGLIVDYRGLVEPLKDAMDMYSGSGLENFDSNDIKGVMVDVISCIGKLRESFSQLDELFINIHNIDDAEEIELFLADDAKRDSFYNLLCMFGKYLHIVLNSDKAYTAIPKNELEKYQQAFIFYSKVRRSVKIRYCDAIDNREYEPLMQNLLDTNLSVSGLKQITPPIDIMNSTEFEKEIDKLGNQRSKADAISNRLSKSISEKMDENPAYYDSFSKRIKKVLEEYKDKRITDAEYLSQMRKILDDYRSGKSEISFPESIQNNIHAQAFYGVLGSLFEKNIKEDSQKPSVEFIASMAIDITEIVKKHAQVDFQHSVSIQNQIAQDIDDLFYKYEKERGFKIPFDLIDSIIEKIKAVALKRF